MDNETKQADRRDAWTALLLGLAMTWADPVVVDKPAPKDSGDRFLAAARAVSRGT